MIRPSWSLARKAILPVIALVLVVFAASILTRPKDKATQPVNPPAGASPALGAVVAALGVVEPAGETVAIAVDTPGVVRDVYVRAGQDVQAGQPLFRIDSRAVVADLARAEAAVRVNEIAAADSRSRNALFKGIDDPEAVSTDERDRAQFAAQRAAADLDLARAEAQRLRVDLERLTVRAPFAARILRLNVRVGEFAPAGTVSQPLIALGRVSPLHVRVQIDEEDIGRVSRDAMAEGSLRGEASRKAPLTFVRFEPEAQPKRNLNGGTERVDTRVVEAIYALDPGRLPAFVGQQMDVFIRATPSAKTGVVR